MEKAGEKRGRRKPFDRKAYPKADPEKRQAYVQANREKINAMKRAYYAANAEKIKTLSRAYYAANSDKINAEQRALRKANKEKLAAERRAEGEVDTPRTVHRRRVVLTAGAIPEIRQKYRSGMTAKAIASQYDVAQFTIYAVLTGKTWRHVPDPDGPVVMRRIGRPLMNPNG